MGGRGKGVGAGQIDMSRPIFNHTSSGRRRHRNHCCRNFVGCRIWRNQPKHNMVVKFLGVFFYRLTVHTIGRIGTHNIITAVYLPAWGLGAFARHVSFFVFRFLGPRMIVVGSDGS